MSESLKQKPKFMWRFVIYGVIVAALLCLQGYVRHDPICYGAAVTAMLFFIGFGLMRNWLKENPAVFLRILTVLVIIGLFAGIIATVIDILNLKKR